MKKEIKKYFSVFLMLAVTAAISAFPILLPLSVAADTYYLKEVEFPSGYVLLSSPIKIEIHPATDAEGKITKGEYTLKVSDAAVPVKTGNHIAQFSKKDAIAAIAVKNHKGVSLPIAGGSGILFTILLSAAGLLFLSAHTLLSKRHSH